MTINEIVDPVYQELTDITEKRVLLNVVRRGKEPTIALLEFFAENHDEEEIVSTSLKAIENLRE